MADVPTTLCRLGPSAFGIAHGALSDSLVVTIQGDGILEYDTSTQVNDGRFLLSPDHMSAASAILVLLATRDESQYKKRRTLFTRLLHH